MRRTLWTMIPILRSPSLGHRLLKVNLKRRRRRNLSEIKGTLSRREMGMLGKGALSRGEILMLGKGALSRGEILMLGKGALSRGEILMLGKGALSRGEILMLGKGALSRGEMGLLGKEELSRGEFVLRGRNVVVSKQSFHVCRYYLELLRTLTNLLYFRSGSEYSNSDEEVVSKKWKTRSRRRGRRNAGGGFQCSKLGSLVHCFTIYKPVEHIFMSFFPDRLFTESESEASDTEASSKVSDAWWADQLTPEDQHRLGTSGKLVLMAEILKMCDDIGDKL